MLMCKCGNKAHLDDIDGLKKGTRVLYYLCEHCNYGYTFNEKTGEITEMPPE